MAVLTDRIPAMVRERRSTRGISRERLAALCNVSTSTITRLELNGQLPSSQTMFAIADALDLDLNDFIGRAPAAEEQIPA